MSLEKLLKLADCPTLPTDLSNWFRHGVEQFVGGGISLDECLDLSNTDGKQLAGIRRDRYLRQAAKHLEAAGPTERARKLAKEVKRFEAIIWPQWRLKPEPPERAPELSKCLFHARRQREFPESKRQLYRILTE